MLPQQRNVQLNFKCPMHLTLLITTPRRHNKSFKVYFNPTKLMKLKSVYLYCVAGGHHILLQQKATIFQGSHRDYSRTEGITVRCVLWPQLHSISNHRSDRTDVGHRFVVTDASHAAPRCCCCCCCASPSRCCCCCCCCASPSRCCCCCYTAVVNLRAEEG